MYELKNKRYERKKYDRRKHESIVEKQQNIDRQSQLVAGKTGTLHLHPGNRMVGFLRGMAFPEDGKRGYELKTRKG